MHRLLPALVLVPLVLWGGTDTKKQHGAKTPAKSSQSKKPPQGSPAKKSAKGHGVKSKSSHSPKRSTQQVPTPERYRDIQEALAAKGYFNAEANGKWGADSVDALKRFQHEQGIEETGKLDSVSLIALGLGPKRSARLTTQPSDK